MLKCSFSFTPAEEGEEEICMQHGQTCDQIIKVGCDFVQARQSCLIVFGEGMCTREKLVVLLSRL